MPARDPKIDPRPGDLLVGPVLKARVERITLGANSAIETVEYIISHVDHPFAKQKGCVVSLAQWQRCVQGPNIVVCPF